MKMRNLIIAFGLIFVLVAGAVSAQNGSGGFLGVRLQDSEDGVVIREVVEGSPAAAVLQVDDIVTAVNGAEVSTAADVAAAVQTAAPGETLTEDAQHLAYKQGRDRLALEVGAGQHRLCLQVANNSGIALDGPGMVQVIDIVVE